MSFSRYLVEKYIETASGHEFRPSMLLSHTSFPGFLSVPTFLSFCWDFTSDFVYLLPPVVLAARSILLKGRDHALDSARGTHSMQLEYTELTLIGPTTFSYLRVAGVSETVYSHRGRVRLFNIPNHHAKCRVDLTPGQSLPLQFDSPFPQPRPFRHTS